MKYYSVWIEPYTEVALRIEALRAGLPASVPNRQAVMALPPWFLYALAQFEPPPPPERPEWVPHFEKVSHRIIRRDRSAGLYSSPFFRVEGQVCNVVCGGLPGRLLGLRVSQKGGVLPDIRLYNGELGAKGQVRAPLPQFEAAPLYIPLVCFANSSTPADVQAQLKETVSELCAEQIGTAPIVVQRSSIHLVRMDINIEEDIEYGVYIDSFAWESMCQIDLTRYKER